MSELNVDIPHFYCHVRAEYLYDGKSHQGETIPCMVFGASSIMGRAIGFHILTERGAMIYRLPISAIIHNPKAPHLSFDTLELWDCFSYNMVATVYSGIRELRCRTMLKDQKWYMGTYQFTFDWFGSQFAEEPGEGGHKCSHLIRLDNGCYAAQPNNRIYWYEPSFIANPYRVNEHPDFLTNSRVWKCESIGKWHSSNDEKMFYQIVKEGTESRKEVANAPSNKRSSTKGNRSTK